MDWIELSISITYQKDSQYGNSNIVYFILRFHISYHFNTTHNSSSYNVFYYNSWNLKQLILDNRFFQRDYIALLEVVSHFVPCNSKDLKRIIKRVIEVEIILILLTD